MTDANSYLIVSEGTVEGQRLKIRKIARPLNPDMMDAPLIVSEGIGEGQRRQIIKVARKKNHDIMDAEGKNVRRSTRQKEKVFYDDETHQIAVDKIMTRKRFPGIGIAKSTYGGSKESGRGLFTTIDRKVNRQPNDETLLAMWEGDYITDPLVAKNRSLTNDSVIKCAVGVWLVPKEGSLPTLINDSLKHYNAHVHWNGQQLELHSMGYMERGDEFSLQYGLQYWLRRLNIVDLNALENKYGEKLTQTPHYDIFTRLGIHQYCLYLDTNDSWENHFSNDE